MTIQVNPSYNVNNTLRMTNASFSDQYAYIDPAQRLVSTDDDIYDDVSGVHEYATIT